MGHQLRRLTSELEQIASPLPGEIAKRRKRPAWSIAATAFDDRRFRRSLGVGDLNRHAAAGVAYKLELRQITHG
jgi:hypothetical protein